LKGSIVLNLHDTRSEIRYLPARTSLEWTQWNGKVTDKSGGRITVAAVLVQPDRQMTKARQSPDFGADIRLEVDQKGEFTAVLAPGLYDVVAFANVFSPQCAKVRITEGGLEERDFVLPLDPAVLRTID
jgi:hypothetical protein